jgi:hypothetical protein
MGPRGAAPRRASPMNATAEAGMSPARRPRRRRAALGASALRALTIGVGAATLLALLTIVTFGYLPRYQPDGQTVLDNADFREGFRGWQVDGLVTLDETELGHAILQNLDRTREAYIRRTIPLPAGPTSLRLRADVATSRVEHGREPWQTARVYLVPQTADGRRLWNQPHQLVNLVGTTPRQHFEAIFDVSGTVPEVTLGIELPYTTGRMEIARLGLSIVDERTPFRLAAALLVCGWSLLAFRVTSGLYRSIHIPLVRHWLLATLAVLVIGLFIPALLRQQLIDRLASGFGWRLPDPDAFGHAVVFGLLALLVRIGRPRDPLLVHFSCWLLVGAVAEVLQLLTPDRAPAAGDWLIAAIGSSLGLALGELGLWIRRRLERARRAARPPSLEAEPRD